MNTKTEAILCIAKKDLNVAYLPHCASMHIKLDDFCRELHSPVFINRTEAEKDLSYKQIIPYILCRKDSDIFCYKRRGSEKKLHSFWSCGIGGHINDTDKGSTIQETIWNGLQREIIEEIGIENACPVFKGIINEEQTAVGLVHIGLVYELICNFDDIKRELEVSESAVKDIRNINFDQFELWSKLALELITF